ncbi:MAG: serpin family protein [Actinomycetia bacterium]|nr:serpin family protein [Actinomycetes bacterium]
MSRPFTTSAALFVVAALTAAACGSDSESAIFVEADLARASASPSTLDPTATAAGAFAVDLYRELASDNADNLIFSPHSIAVALAMTRAGATGDTGAAMDRVLHTSDLTDLHGGFNSLDQLLGDKAGEYERADGSTATLELNIANAVWGQVDTTFEAAFLETLAVNYGAGMRLVDYQADAEGARHSINAWVAEETSDRITDLVPEGALNSLTRLVLTNAVYLLAPWELPFSDGATQPAPFTTLDGTEVEAELMFLSESLAHARVGEAEVVSLPYAGRLLEMVVIIPDPGSFAATEVQLTTGLLDDIDSALTPTPVNLRLPRFEFRTQAGLADVLRSLGMEIAFDPSAAEFSGMTTEEDLFISDVIHEAFISIDEEGTEAAAATAVVVSTTSAPAEPIELTVDRPFIFVLRDADTSAILFLGRVLDPTA